MILTMIWSELKVRYMHGIRHSEGVGRARMIPIAS